MARPDHLTVDDDELDRLALAADPDEPIPPDAIPWAELMAAETPDGSPLLPSWYMPAPVASATGRSRRRTAVVGLVVVTLLVVNAVGLCVTNGQLEIAW